MSKATLKQGRGEGRKGLAALALEQMLKASDIVLDILPIGLCIYDRAGRIVQFNRRAVEIWGRTPQPGQTRDEFTVGGKFYWPDGRPLTRDEAPLTTVLATGGSGRNREMIAEREDGVRRVVAVNIDPLRDAAGNLLGAINCFQDITERH